MKKILLALVLLSTPAQAADSITCAFGEVTAELQVVSPDFIGPLNVDTYYNNKVPEGMLLIGIEDSILVQPSGEALMRPNGVGMGTIGECH